MTPQAAMTAFLLLLTLGGIYKAAGECTPAEAVGSVLAILTRYAIIAAIAWWGGFYGA